MIRLDERAKTPLYEQIYMQIRQGVVDGTYAPKSKLASIRELAEQLHCSRNTVEAAYRMLLQEGFVYSKPGSGMVVEDRLPLGWNDDATNGFEDSKTKSSPGGKPHAKTPNAIGSDGRRPRYDFTYGNLENGTFPALLWKSLTDDILLGIDASKANSYGDNNGELELRQEIVRMVAKLRGIKCSPEQIVVQAGTQASLQNLVLLFDPATDIVGMEEPGYDGVRQVFERNRFTLSSCPIDARSYEPFMNACRENQPKLVYTTPSNQFPTGMVMQLEMRQKLIEWAEETDAYLIEDDYCHEFLYKDSPLPSLKSLDTHGRVIYMGTFSKSLSPALRMNFLILPQALLEKWNALFEGSYSSVPWISQAVLCRCLQSDQRARQLRRVQTRCRRKHQILNDSLRKYMGDRVEPLAHGAGLHLLVKVHGNRTQEELIALAYDAGVKVYPTESYWLREENVLENCVLIGFSAIPEEDIEPGIQTLARAWFDQDA